MYVLDLEKTAEENFLGLINSGSAVILTADDFTASHPQFNVPEDPQESTNTLVKLTATESSELSGTTEIRYRRWKVGQTGQTPIDQIEVPSNKTREELIAEIIESQGLLASEVEFVGLEQAMPQLGEELILIMLAKENSYIYYGSQVITVIGIAAEVEA